MNKLQARLWLEKAAQQQDADAIAWLESAANAAWYTRLENWIHAALDGELSGVADCPVPPIAGTRPRYGGRPV